MNVYIEQTAVRMAQRGVAVEIFTRATSSDQPPIVELAPGVQVRHVAAGRRGLSKNELPSQLCAFTAGVLRIEAFYEPGHYDVVHSHYWLSGQAGWLARDRWRVPWCTVRTPGQGQERRARRRRHPEPRSRVIARSRWSPRRPADRQHRGGVRPARGPVRGRPGAHGDHPARRRPAPLRARGPARRARCAALAPDAVVLAFVGRIQPLKAPDVLLYAAAELLAGARAEGTDAERALRRRWWC